MLNVENALVVDVNVGIREKHIEFFSGLWRRWFAARTAR
jgi:hypothetical protein